MPNLSEEKCATKSEVREQLNKMNINLEVLGKHILVIEEKLSIVLKPREQKPKGDIDKDISLCDLADELRNKNNAITDRNNDIQALINAIEL